MRPMAFATALVAVVLAGAGRASADQTELRAVDAAKSTAQFCIQHVFVSRVCGTVPIAAGTVELSAGSLIPAKVTASLDPSRIDTGEPDRDASLESPDYFDVKQFPTWSFASAKVAATGASAFGMDGDLTMHGVTQSEHLDVTVTGDAVHPVYHASGQIDRRAFQMKGTRLDPVIGNVADVTLEIRLK